MSKKVTHSDIEFSPIEEISRSLKFWWVVCIFILVGAFVGWCFHFTQPPLYESQVTYVISIDYTRVRSISEYETDAAINSASFLLISQEVIDNVLGDLSANGIHLSPEELRTMYRLERKQTTIVIYVRNSNRELADQIVTIWADRATSAISSAYQHTTYAAYLEKALDRSQGIISNLLLSTPNRITSQKISEIQSSIKGFSDLLTKEREASKNLFPGLQISFNGIELSSMTPAYYNISTLTLCGGLIGMVLGITLVLTIIPQMAFTKKK